MGHPFHHPPEPAVRDEHKVTVRLYKTPLAVDLLVEERFRQLPRPANRLAHMVSIIAQAPAKPSGPVALSLSRSVLSLARLSRAALHLFCILRGTAGGPSTNRRYAGIFPAKSMPNVSDK